MFSKESITKIIQSWHPDHYKPKGLIELFQEEANDVVKQIELGDLKTVKNSVKQVFPRHVKDSNEYLKNWDAITSKLSEEEYQQEIVESKWNKNMNMYPYGIMLRLNPIQVERQLKKKGLSDYKKIAAYITRVVEAELIDVFKCMDKKGSDNNEKHKMTLSMPYAQQCVQL